MLTITIFLAMLCALLASALWTRFKAEADSINAIMNLSDDARRYVLLAIDQPRIEPHEQSEGGRELLAQLIDDEWLEQLYDGAISAGYKSEYIGTKMKRTWSIPEKLDQRCASD